MNVLRIAALLLALGVLQTTLSQLWAPLGLVDWLMIAVVVHALRHPFRDAVSTAAFAGLLQDGLSGGIIGLHAFGKTAVAAGLASLGNIFLVRGLFAECLLVGTATILEGALTAGLLTYLGRPAAVGSTIITGRGLATALAAAGVLYAQPLLVARWRRWRA